MSDVLAFRVAFGSLRPADPAAEDALRAMANGTLCSVTIKRSSRSLKRMRFYRAMLKAACNVLEQQTPGLHADDLHDELRDALGMVTRITTPSGRVIRRLHSTAFNKMDEATFSAFVTRVDGLLSRWIGCPPGCVIDEARAMTAQEQAA